MPRRPHFVLVVLTVAMLAIAGCSLVVDFDRSLLVDAGTDAGEGGVGGAGGESSDAEDVPDAN